VLLSTCSFVDNLLLDQLNQEWATPRLFIVTGTKEGISSNAFLIRNLAKSWNY
jgi:hypothetical protein